MEKIFIKARAKINLTLDILNKREDGYHNLQSIMQCIQLYDELHVEKVIGDRIELNCNIDLLNNENNIVHKTCNLIKLKYNINAGVKINLIKHVPLEAGIGGGSADAAATIIALNKLFSLNLSQAEMIDVGRSLGADVPPCLAKQTVLAEGIGENLTPIDTKLKLYILLIKPKFSCSTKKMFGKLDSKEYENNYDKTSQAILALKQNDTQELKHTIFNVFENALDENEKNIVDKAKMELIQNGAIGAQMTGSGSCVFGIFETKGSIKRAYNNLKNGYETYYTLTY